MFTKHFFKVLIIFAFIIACGLMGVLLASRFDDTPAEADPINSSQFAK